MPAGVGETLLVTLFADCHYYFSDPSSKPPHHRFDRGSYVYLFYNSTARQAKLEVANNAGTAEQDAFHGYLNVANVAYSYLQPTLCTLFINTGAVQDQSTWHLPTLDPRNEQKYSYKLHAVDIYFWTEKDAGTFLSNLKNILGGDKFDIKHAPASASSGFASPSHSEHRDSMSPVVQLLEKTAVGTHFPPRAPSAVSAQSFPGPPTPATSGGGASPNPVPAPMAYNPAAPAAPEPVVFREKTPPPIDENGTGLGMVAKYDSAPPQNHSYGGLSGMGYGNTSQPIHFSGPPPQQYQHQPRQASQTSFPGPPPQTSGSMENVPRTFSGSVPPPPPQGQHRAPSFGPMAQSTLPQSPPPGQTSFQRQSVTPTQQHAIYTPGQPQSQYATVASPPAYSTPLQSPGFPGPPPPHQQQQQQQQNVPIGGYGHYSYSAAQTPQAGEFGNMGAYQGDLHSQVYRPTEAEVGSHVKPASTTAKPEGKVGKVEGNVNKYLKKLDKLW
ncbi:uncharacterized protein RCC_08188 [Ramularia collo-cygni]|uniref:RNA recognition motif-containing protein n=1 Tax=Ramularia collo-cygni TaxID=112498 RepID=A0A2D3VJP1_9PEZI|nr:uncharacterized protein RCC_08188 [Ramularia collo-cygni]CZT22319.1 uncharacterized protein RCC_08188 [Ramularia collo-cygni]